MNRLFLMFLNLLSNEIFTNCNSNLNLTLLDKRSFGSSEKFAALLLFFPQVSVDVFSGFNFVVLLGDSATEKEEVFFGLKLQQKDLRCKTV